MNSDQALAQVAGTDAQDRAFLERRGYLMRTAHERHVLSRWLRLLVRVALSELSELSERREIGEGYCILRLRRQVCPRGCRGTPRFDGLQLARRKATRSAILAH